MRHVSVIGQGRRAQPFQCRISVPLISIRELTGRESYPTAQALVAETALTENS